MTMETWEHRDIITNGIRMHYVTQGSGPLVVLLHGFPEFWYSWRYQIPFLAEHGYTVVAPDLRGYNDTDKPRKGYDVPTLLRDIAGLIRGLGQDQAIIVGHDWGGGLAWQFAIHYPYMTSRLIVMNAPHLYAMLREFRTLKQLRKSWYIFFFQIPWLPEAIARASRYAFVRRALERDPMRAGAYSARDISLYLDAIAQPGALTATTNYYRALIRYGPQALR